MRFVDWNPQTFLQMENLGINQRLGWIFLKKSNSLGYLMFEENISNNFWWSSVGMLIMGKNP